MEPATPEEVDEACSLLAQGDVLALSEIHAGGTTRPAPEGVAILSQTCDVVRGNRPNLVISEVVRLKGDHARAARDGERPRWIHLPALGDELFADLEYIETIDKRQVVSVSARNGVDPANWRHQRKLALAIGRRFSRMALADEVVPWFAPLQEIVRSKFDNPASPLFNALEAITEFRIESTSGTWAPPDLEFTLHIILRAGEMPLLADDDVTPPADLGTWLKRPRNPGEIAERLFPAGERPTGIARDALWRAFGESFAGKAKPSAKERLDPGVANAVANVTSAVVGEEDFTLLQWRRSDELDLAHLSAPTPDPS